MPQIKTYFVKIRHIFLSVKKPSKKFAVIFSLGLLSFASIVSMSLAGFFSSSLSVGLYYSQEIFCAAESKVFLVYQAKSRLLLEAESLAEDCTSGGRYIWHEGEYFYVIHSASESKNDANLIVKDFEKRQISAQVLAITFPQILMEENFSQDEHNQVTSAFSEFLSSFRCLSDLAVGAQSQVYDEQLIQEKLQNLKEKLEKTNSSFFAHFSKFSDIKTVALSEYLADLLEVVSLAKTDSSSLWHSAIEILEIYKNLTNELK